MVWRFLLGDVDDTGKVTWRLQAMLREVKLRVVLAGVAACLWTIQLAAQTGTAVAASGGASKESGVKSVKKVSNPGESSAHSPKKAAGRSFHLEPSGKLRAAPINEGVQGGYSSGMEAAQPPVANPALEEQVMRQLLIGASKWRVGPHGLIERLGRNGHWKIESSGVTTNLHSIVFVNARVGWAVGDQGTIVRTVDAGQHWHVVAFPHPDDLIRVQATGLTSARVTTRDGSVFRTTNGGKSWRKDQAWGEKSDRTGP